jgi:SsrA-binding protein
VTLLVQDGNQDIGHVEHGNHNPSQKCGGFLFYIKFYIIFVPMKEGVNIVNRRAKHEYEFLDTYQAGMVLTGVEVKFIRDGKLSFVDSYCMFHDGELFMKNVSISGIGTDNIKRDRKLLLRKRELVKLQKSLDKGLSIIPYKIYQVKNTLKVDIVLARGKKLHDKRQTMKEKDIQKEISRTLK